MGEKTEKATPKKLRDAKRKGQVAKSQDFPAAFTFVVSMAATLSLSTDIFHQLGQLIMGCFSLATSTNLDEVLKGMFYQAFYIIFTCSMPIMVFVCIAGVLVTFLTVGPVWAPEVFKFDIKKFNPVDNLKSKFKMKTFIELLKSLFKISVAGYIVYAIMMRHMGELTQTIGLPMQVSGAVFAAFLKEVVFQVGLFFVVVAIADLLYQKHNFEKEMKMEKFEVKQEYKDSEGDPHIKGKRKQIAHEIAYSEGPAAGASRAKAVVSNPTHLAIALGFDREVDPCPFVLAMGQGHVAEKIIKIAEDNKIPVIRNIPLAHKLWEEAKLYEYIPEETYEPVAEILRWIASLEYDNVGLPS